jgi:uncharacterized membrane protein YjgN (DUF898 family)
VRLLPVLALWWTPQLLSLLDVDVGAYTGLVIPATWPWMHHRLKAYQHDRATYGNRHFAFDAPVGRFYGVYAKGFGLIVVCALLVGFIIAFAIALGEGSSDSSVLGWLYAAFFGLFFYVVVAPYYAARLQQIVWSHTQLGGIRFHLRLSAAELYKLAFKNAALTVLSCGLYWPWAAVAIARYQLGCLELESDGSISVPAMAITAPHVDAAGDGSLDAFGLDIGL